MGLILSGTHTLPETGEPLANAEFYAVAKRTEAAGIVKNTSSKWTTDANGAYSVELETGWYAISFSWLSPDGSINARRQSLGDIWVEPGTTTTLNALLSLNESAADPVDAALLQLVADAQAARDEAVAAANNIPGTVRSVVLTGLSLASSAAVTASDTILSAFGKIQAKLNTLKTAAFADLTTSSTDTTAGRVLKVGDFGLGGQTPTLSSVDLNTVLTSGLYYAFGSTSNKPPGAVVGHVLIMSAASTVCSQLYQEVTSKRAWYRQYYSGAWGGWTPIYHAENILGTVSQSGGVPTGAVIERGSNANGEYVRYADGTQICWWSITLTRTPTSTSDTNFKSYWLASGGQATPASFSSTPKSFVRASKSNNGYVWGLMGAPSTSNFGPNVRCLELNSIAEEGDYTFDLFAIGRWF